MALNNSSMKQYLVLKEYYDELKKIYTQWAQHSNGVVRNGALK